jgi:hypothetical protein
LVVHYNTLQHVAAAEVEVDENEGGEQFIVIE